MKINLAIVCAVLTALTLAGAATTSAAINPHVTVSKKVSVSKRNGSVGARVRVSTDSSVDLTTVAPYRAVKLQFSNVKVNRKVFRCPAGKPGPGQSVTCPDKSIVGKFSFELRARDQNGIWQQCPDPTRFTLQYETKLANFPGNDVVQLTEITGAGGNGGRGIVDFNAYGVSFNFSDLLTVMSFATDPVWGGLACDPLLNAGAHPTVFISDLQFDLNASTRSRQSYFVAKNPRKKVKLTVSTPEPGQL